MNKESEDLSVEGIKTLLEEYLTIDTERNDFTFNDHHYITGIEDAAASLHELIENNKKISESDKSIVDWFEFSEWCGKHYIRMEKVWCHMYSDQRDQKNWYTTETLYKLYQGHKNIIEG